MKKVLKTSIKSIVIAIVILFTGIGIMIFVPTEMTCSSDTLFVEERLHRDLSIGRNQLKFVAGKFRRESIIVYRVQELDMTISKFRRIIAEEQKRDYVKRAVKIMVSCEHRY